MNVDEALRDVADALATTDGARGRDAGLRAARQVLAGRCMAMLGMEPQGQPSLADVVRLAADAPGGSARRACAVLLVHALAVPRLVPTGSAEAVRVLVEGSLRDVLLRCGYRFGGSLEEKLRILQRLHATIGELMQPMEPTFPNWQGLYAG